MWVYSISDTNVEPFWKKTGYTSGEFTDRNDEFDSEFDFDSESESVDRTESK